MTDPAPAVAQCPRGGYSCGERGFLCGECTELRADARCLARMAQDAVNVWTVKMDRKDAESTLPQEVIDFYDISITLAAQALRLARKAVRG